jgi:uncharacterized membrane protein
VRNFYLPVGLAISSSLLYHLSQKSIPKGMNPFFATIIAYLIGIVLCTICAFIFPNNKSLVDSFKELNWAVFALGVAVVGVELGYLLAYRAGWKISIAAAANSVVVTASLVLIGIVIFREQLSFLKVVGLIFCALGFILVVRE